jgi:hypothetical protein
VFKAQTALHVADTDSKVSLERIGAGVARLVKVESPNCPDEFIPQQRILLSRVIPQVEYRLVVTAENFDAVSTRCGVASIKFWKQLGR